MATARRQAIVEAAEVLRQVLAAVDAGELTADGPAGANLVRQIRGAVAALQAVAEESPPTGDDG